MGASETPARSNSPEGRVHAEVYVRNATSATRTINDIASLLTVHAAIDGVWAIASDWCSCWWCEIMPMDQKGIPGRLPWWSSLVKGTREVAHTFSSRWTFSDRVQQARTGEFNEIVTQRLRGAPPGPRLRRQPVVLTFPANTIELPPPRGAVKPSEKLDTRGQLYAFSYFDMLQLCSRTRPPDFPWFEVLWSTSLGVVSVEAKTHQMSGGHLGMTNDYLSIRGCRTSWAPIGIQAQALSKQHVTSQ